MKYINTCFYHSRYTDVDFKDEMKLSSVLGYLQESACASADELGFGYDYLKGLNYGFVAAATYVKLYKSIGTADFKINTWPTAPRHFIFERYYEIYSADGEKTADACSRWCLVDLSNFKILPGSALVNQDYSTYNTEKSINVPMWKLPPFEEENAEKSFSLKIGNSECDHYMHVNNTRYADYVFNCFTMDYLAERKLDSFLICYIKQIHEGDEITLYKILRPDGCFDIYAFNRENELVFTSRVIFENK